MFVEKPLDATTPRVLSMRPTKEPDWKQTATDLEAQTQWSVRQIQRKDSELNIVLESVFGIYVTERLDKAVAVLHRDAPEGISRFIFTFTEGGIAFSSVGQPRARCGFATKIIVKHFGPLPKRHLLC